MFRTNWKTAAFTFAGLGVIAPAQGDQVTDMQAQIDALRAELSEVQTQQDDNWLNERRAEEVKGLIMEVLSDADTRASLLNDGATAGHDGEHFFIGSADGAFLMQVYGQLQFRYVWNNQDDETRANVPDDDEDEGGFQTRRAKVGFKGHISSPKIKYKVQLATETDNGNLFLEEWMVSYDMSENWTVQGGNMKLPFLREELVSSSKQLAAERSTTNEFFTLNRAEGVGLHYTDGPLSIQTRISDGSNTGINDFDENPAEFAGTVRIDYAFMGTVDQGREFRGWSGEDESLVVGAAVHNELGDGRNGREADYLAFTVDASYKTGPINLYAAYIYGEIEYDDSSIDDRDMSGFVAQLGYDINPDKWDVFGRYEFIDGDVSGEDDFDAWTIGTNYYVNGHRAKFTLDFVWLMEDVPTSNPFGASPDDTGLGLITGNEDETAVRGQFQLLF